MKVRLTDRDLQEILYERDLPSDFKSSNGVEEGFFQLDHHYGKASFKEQWFEGVHISSGEVVLKEDIQVRIESPAPVIEMHFSLSGASNVFISGSRKAFAFDARRHNIFYRPHFDGLLETGRQRDPVRTFEVHLTENYFNRIINDQCPALQAFSNFAEKQELVSLSRENLHITAQMDTVLREMTHCQKSGVIKRLFLESKVLELLSLQIEQYESACTKKGKDSVKEGDLDKLHHARYLVEKNLGDPYSLSELARLTGLNEFKLKSGFKKIFGNTVFGYLHGLRMEEARKLLLDERRPLAEVADYCGYEHVQHFITAFKKKYGVTPGKYRA